MNDDYSDAFKSIVPEAPTADGWADGARRKRRDRGRIVAGVAAAAAVALVVPFALTLSSDSTLIATPGRSETPSPRVTGPSPDPAADAPGAAACWEAPGQPRQATAEGAADGAIRAWLCGDAGSSESLPGAVGPLEPLVDGVDEIVSFIGAQQTLDASGVTACTEEYILAYRVVLDYGDGNSRVVPGALHGCKTIEDGSTVRTGGQELHDLALDLWSQQRERVDPPGDVVAVSQCRPPSRSVVPDLPPALRPMLPLVPVDAVTGFTCAENPAAEYEASRGSTLEPDLAARIGQSMTTDSEEGLGEDHLPTWVTITGPWGEAITLQRTRDDAFQWFDGQTPMLWKPPADLLAELEQSLEAPELSNSTAPPEDQCDLDAEGRMATTDLPQNTLPDGPAAVWLCGGWRWRSPLEPLVDQQATQQVVDSFRALSTSPTNDGTGASLYNYLIVDYPDGERYVVQIQSSQPFEVMWGSELEHIRYGDPEWVWELEGLWARQRDDNPQDPPIPPRVGICDNMYRSFGRSIDHYDEDGALCTVIRTDGGEVEGVEIPSSPQLVKDVRAEAQKSSAPWPQEVSLSLAEWHGDAILLVDDYGDRLPILRLGDRWMWQKGGDAFEWTPSPDLVARLAHAFGSGRPSPQSTPS